MERETSANSNIPKRLLDPATVERRISHLGLTEQLRFLCRLNGRTLSIGIGIASSAEPTIPPIRPHNFTIEFFLTQLGLKPLRGKEWSVSLFLRASSSSVSLVASARISAGPARPRVQNLVLKIQYQGQLTTNILAAKNRSFFTSDPVPPRHPDQTLRQISDAILSP